MANTYRVLICCILGVTILFAQGCSNEKEKATQERIQIENSKAVVGASAPKLAELYRKNSLKVQQEFENKIIVVYGKVASVGAFKEQPDVLYISLGEYHEFQVLAQFRDVYKKDLQSLNPGDVVCIQGKCFLGKDNNTIFVDGARVVSNKSLNDVPALYAFR
jgi:hypothetical protein